MKKRAKSPAKPAASQKAALKKAASKKAAAKTSAVKKTVGKKTANKKAASKKTATKKTAKKALVKKAGAKSAIKASAAKKAAVKAPAPKVPAKRASANSVSTKKVAAKTVVTKKVEKTPSGLPPGTTIVQRPGEPLTITLSPPRAASFNPDRSLDRNLLLKNQVSHFHQLEQDYPEHLRSGIALEAIRTEGQAADYIRRVTMLLQTHAHPTQTQVQGS